MIVAGIVDERVEEECTVFVRGVGVASMDKMCCVIRVFCLAT
jgi:hypothetical protein